ncbi:MAG: hypothetical protein AAFX01_14175 [Cyanobacteria bacterium J06638_28]
MKRFLFSALSIALAIAVAAPMASARQTHLNDLRADLNGDGEVTIGELRRYNRDARQS